MEYIILNGKTPAHPFKTKETTKTWADVKDFDSVGVVVPEGYLVLDFDTASDAEIMLEIIEALDLKVRVMKTTRGIHVWFKNTAQGIEKNFIKSRLAIGIYSDCKNSNKRSYVKIKQEGEMREVLRHMKMDEIQEVPKWLHPISSPKNNFLFKGMGDGSGRNQELFNYIVYLQTKGFKRDEVRETIEIINTFVFGDPLPDNEIELICRDEAFKSDEEIEQQVEERAAKVEGFKHNEFGDELIEAFNIITVNGQLFVYEDGYYQQDERIIERKMIELYPSIKQNQRGEVLAYIRIKTHLHYDELKVNPYIINIKNTRLNVKTGDLLPFTPDAIEFDRIPVTYDPSAYSADLDKMLQRVFLSDKEVINLFDEMVGYMLIKHARYRAGFMFTGNGKNGKSTILDLLKTFIGKRNYSTIELHKLTDRFATAELEHKLANIGDDINSSIIKDTGTLKKLFTGNSVQVERKGERPFNLEPYAKMIFSMNEIPQSYDKSDGFYSRLMFIPFKARFESTDEDFDPNIGDKIVTDEALSYLLNRAIKGAQRLMKNGSFTQPAIVKKAIDGYRTNNSTTLSWLQDEEKGLDYLLDTPKDEIYGEYSDWCKVSGVKLGEQMGKIKFYKELRDHFGLEDAQKRVDQKLKRYFILSLD